MFRCYQVDLIFLVKNSRFDFVFKISFKLKLEFRVYLDEIIF
jgi:hypothetical protein